MMIVYGNLHNRDKGAGNFRFNQSIEFEEQIQQYAKCSVFDRLKKLERLPDGRYYSILKRKIDGEYQEVEGMPYVEICKDSNVITLLPDTLPFC